MRKKVFISYYFEDSTFQGEVKTWIEEAEVEVITTNKRDLTPEAKIMAKERIKTQILSSSLILVLVGNDTHNRPWIDYEVAVAKSKQIPVYWVKLPNSTGAPPEEVRGLKHLEYSETEIKRLVK